MRVAATIAVTRQPRDKYYKDEGGRKNCLYMSVRVTNICVDERAITKDHPLAQRQLPVALAVFYESGQRVEKRDQSILEVAGEPFLLFNGNEKQIEFRINKVSRRFNGKKFKVQVRASRRTIYGGRYDLSGVKPAFSRATEVFSKRKRRSLDTSDKAKRLKMTAMQTLYDLDTKLEARILELTCRVGRNQLRITACKLTTDASQSRSPDHPNTPRSQQFDRRTNTTTKELRKY